MRRMRPEEKFRAAVRRALQKEANRILREALARPLPPLAWAYRFRELPLGLFLEENDE